MTKQSDRNATRKPTGRVSENARYDLGKRQPNAALTLARRAGFAALLIAAAVGVGDLGSLALDAHQRRRRRAR